MKKKIIYLAVLAVLIGGFFYFIKFTPKTEVITVNQRPGVDMQNVSVNSNINGDAVKKIKTIENENINVNPIEEKTIKATEPIKEESFIEEKISVEIPVKKILIVPFTSQAPYADWSMPYKEACEEASAIILDHFFSGRELNKDIATKEINDLVDWQMKNWGEHKDLTAAETAKMIEQYYGYKAKVVYDININDIKLEISKGNPVIIPAAGRLLGNKYFRVPGPIYHMLVVIGYDADEIITNDPGTKRGEGYRYTYNTFYNAIHDWTGDEETINQGRKAMIIVSQ